MSNFVLLDIILVNLHALSYDDLYYFIILKL